MTRLHSSLGPGGLILLNKVVIISHLGLQFAFVVLFCFKEMSFYFLFCYLPLCSGTVFKTWFQGRFLLMCMEQSCPYRKHNIIQILTAGLLNHLPVRTVKAFFYSTNSSAQSFMSLVCVFCLLKTVEVGSRRIRLESAEPSGGSGSDLGRSFMVP